LDARKSRLFDPATGDNLTMDAEHAGIVPGGNAMAKAEEVGKEQDEVQPEGT
jgi:multiple sugar transport system ATP-binding protein